MKSMQSFIAINKISLLKVLARLQDYFYNSNNLQKSIIDYFKIKVLRIYCLKGIQKPQIEFLLHTASTTVTSATNG